MNTFPSGTVTFLFTDIEGSTKLAREHPDDWETMRARHDSILREAIESNNGYIFQLVGDSFAAAFHKPGEVLKAAIQAQRALQTSELPDNSVGPVRVRMGIHTGEAEIQADGQYHGYLAMSRVQRLMSAGHGGQILVSHATQELIRDALPKETSLRDMGERRLKDLIRPEHIYQLDIEGLPKEFPVLKTLDKYRHNLPTQLTSFIGREKEIAEVKAALKEHRLVTLTGSGGAGKTRLSLQVATDLLDSFPNGTWFVELAPITDPDLIPQTILSAADMQTQQGRSALDSLKDFLREKTSLVILDNCEHLIEACAKLSDTLLAAAPNLKILASSREALGVKGEQRWHVPSLAIPDLKQLPAIEQLSQYEAVRLFIDRAILVQPHFAVTNDNAPAVAQICSRLDGIPLAIELAAARVKVIKPEQIAEKLNDRFRLLTGGSRTALPRQQTLRALIDWSYDLLSENEKLLLKRLSVFMGGWTLELAEQICFGNGIGPDDILDMMGKLVDKSLVAMTQEKTGTRYRILETVRQYAREKLFESGEGGMLRNKHMRAFLEFAEKIEPEIRGANQLEGLDRMEAEYENVCAALEWSREQDLESCARLVNALWRFWEFRSYELEAKEWYEQILELTQDQRTLTRARILARASSFYRNLTERKKALQLAQNAVTLSRVLNDKATLAQALTTQGELTLEDSEFTSQCYDEALAICNELGGHWQACVIWFNKGQLADRQGDRKAAKTYTAKGVQEARLSKDNRRISLGLAYLGFISLDEGNYTEAKRYMHEGLELSRSVGDANASERVLNIAFVDMFLEDYVEAEALFNEALEGFQQSGSPFSIAVIFMNLAILAWAKGDFPKFVELLSQASNIKQNDEVPITALIDFLWGMTVLLDHDLASAEEKFTSALALTRKLSDRVNMLACLSGFGMLALEKGQLEQAAKIFGAYQKFEPYLQPHIPFIQRKIEEQIITTREQMGNESFEYAFNQGQEMTIEQAVAYALKEANG